MQRSGIMQIVGDSPFPLMYCIIPKEYLTEIRNLYKMMMNKDPITIAGFVESLTKLGAKKAHTNKPQYQGEGRFGLEFY